MLLGEFVDDDVRSSLRTQLTALQPVEVVMPRQPLSSVTARVLRVGLRDPRVAKLTGAAGDWSAEKTYRVRAEEGQHVGRGLALGSGGGGVHGCCCWKWGWNWEWGDGG